MFVRQPPHNENDSKSEQCASDFESFSNCSGCAALNCPAATITVWEMSRAIFVEINDCFVHYSSLFFLVSFIFIIHCCFKDKSHFSVAKNETEIGHVIHSLSLKIAQIR